LGPKRPKKAQKRLKKGIETRRRQSAGANWRLFAQFPTANIQSHSIHCRLSSRRVRTQAHLLPDGFINYYYHPPPNRSARSATLVALWQRGGGGAPKQSQSKHLAARDSLWGACRERCVWSGEQFGRNSPVEATWSQFCARCRQRQSAAKDSLRPETVCGAGPSCARGSLHARFHSARSLQGMELRAVARAFWAQKLANWQTRTLVRARQLGRASAWPEASRRVRYSRQMMNESRRCASAPIAQPPKTPRRGWGPERASDCGREWHLRVASSGQAAALCAGDCSLPLHGQVKTAAARPRGQVSAECVCGAD